jgi:hypothetical protein
VPRMASVCVTGRKAKRRRMSRCRLATVAVDHALQSAAELATAVAYAASVALADGNTRPRLRLRRLRSEFSERRER